MYTQTKPIRGIAGADITQATLQTTLDSLNIDRKIADLSFAEKRMVIIISLTQQLKESIGDMAKTIESPANQTRILHEQWNRLTRAVGNVFLPVISKVLPYVNAILMVLTEIANIIAKLFGYSEGDFYFATGMSDSALELEEALASAGNTADNTAGKVNKIKDALNGLRGFDKLNNLTTPTDSTGGVSGGGGGGLGISPDIMNAFNKAFDDYYSKLNNASMKATEIRDKIMEWLGFQKKINALTGKVEWEYKGITTTLKNIWNWFKKLSPAGKALTLVIAGIFTVKVINLVKKFADLIGKTGLYKSIANLVSPMKSLLGFVTKFTKSSGSLAQGIKTGTDMWTKQLTVIDRLKISLVGAGGLFVGIQLINSGLDDLAKKGELTNSSMIKLAGGFTSAVAGGAILGSQFGVWGAVIGGVTGGVIALYDAFMNYPTAITKTNEAIKKTIEKNNEYYDSLEKQHNLIKDTAIENQSLQTSYQNLANELINITDENGKVKKGYEDRANFIVTTLNNAYGLEIEIINGVIKGYKEQVKSIQGVIDEKRKEIALKTGEEAYTLAKKEELNTYIKLKSSQEAYNTAKENEKKALEEYNKAYENWYIMTANGIKVDTLSTIEKNKAEKAWRKTVETLDDAEKHLDKATKAYDSNTKAIMQYEGLLTADSQENAEAVKKYMNEIENSYYNGKEYITLTNKEILDKSAENYASRLRQAKEYGKDINDEMIAQAESDLKAQNTNLTDLTNNLKGKMGAGLVNAWIALADASETKFMEEFGKLPSDVQQQVVDKMQAKGYKVSEQLQKGLNEKYPTITIKTDTSKANTKLKITADTSSAEKTTSSFWDKLKNAFQTNFGMSIGTLRFASGGLPPVGQLFVANEKGPELVGQIGGQSFVANQNQMMDLLDKKLGNAQNSQPQTYNIYVGSEKVSTVVLKDLKGMAKTNGKPIEIKA